MTSWTQTCILAVLTSKPLPNNEGYFFYHRLLRNPMCSWCNIWSRVWSKKNAQNLVAETVSQIWVRISPNNQHLWQNLALVRNSQLPTTWNLGKFHLLAEKGLQISWFHRQDALEHEFANDVLHLKKKKRKERGIVMDLQNRHGILFWKWSKKEKWAVSRKWSGVLNQII